jgi:hypothetical protein
MVDIISGSGLFGTQTNKTNEQNSTSQTEEETTTSQSAGSAEGSGGTNSTGTETAGAVTAPDAADKGDAKARVNAAVAGAEADAEAVAAAREAVARNNAEEARQSQLREFVLEKIAAAAEPPGDARVRPGNAGLLQDAERSYSARQVPAEQEATSRFDQRV